MEDYIEKTMRAYDRICRTYAKKNRGFAEGYLLSDIKRFLEGLPGRRVLDLGSGGGETAMIFQKYGYHPVCVDISCRMVQAARKKGLEAHQMDFGLLGFPNRYFAGVWANASLFHAPKYRLPLLVYEVWRVLDERGRFYVSVIEGTGEGWRARGIAAPVMRYFSFYRLGEFQDILERNRFRVIERGRLQLPGKDARLLFLAERI